MKKPIKHRCGVIDINTVKQSETQETEIFLRIENILPL